MLSIKQSIDLRASDPRFLYNVNQGPEPEDTFLNYRLGGAYEQYSQLWRDAHISSRLDKRTSSVLGRRVIIESKAEEDTPQDLVDQSLALANALKESIDYEALSRDLIKSGNLMGFAALKVDYALDDASGLILPLFEFVPQSRFNFAYYKPKDYSIPMITSRKLMRSSPIRDQIAMSGSYEVRLLTRSEPILGERIPQERLLLYSFGSSQSIPWGRGLAHQLWPWWQIKTQARNAWLLHSDRTGDPPLLGTYPFENETNEFEKSSVFDLNNPEHRQIYERFVDYCETVSPKGYGVFPDGFQAKYLENLQAAGPDVHERLIHTCDWQMSEAILGEAPYSERPTGGSRAASQTQLTDRESNLTDADCHLIDEALKPLWRNLWILNAAEQLPLPIVRRWSTEDERKIEEENRSHSTRKLTAESDKILVEAGFVPDDEYVEEKYPGWTFVGNNPTPQPLIEEEDTGLEELRESIAHGIIPGGFAGPNSSYPIASTADLDRVLEQMKFSSSSDEIRENAVAIASRFNIELSEEARTQLGESLDYAGASRFVTWRGYKIGIEFEVGQPRFKKPMKMAYGYFVGHIGADKEALDVFLGPHFSSDRIFRVEQLTFEGDFDEYKYMIMFENAAQAEKAYKRQMPKKLFGSIEEVTTKSVDMFAKGAIVLQGIPAAPEMVDASESLEPALRKHVYKLKGKSLPELSELFGVEKDILFQVYDRGADGALSEDYAVRSGLSRVYQFLLGGASREGLDGDLWGLVAS